MEHFFYEKYVSEICKLSGYLHDIGKANTLFQEKIRGGEDLVDLVRHEFLSFYITIKLIENYKEDKSFISKDKFNKIFKDLEQSKKSHNIIYDLSEKFKLKSDYFTFNINEESNLLLNCILFCIISHHVIPSSKDKEDRLVDRTILFNNTNKILFIDPNNEKDLKKLKKNISLFKNFYISEDLEQKINESFINILNLHKELPLVGKEMNYYFKSFSILSRLILVLSDHYSSSQKIAAIEIKKGNSEYNNIYANTNRSFASNIKETPTFNQTLNEHLSMVGDNSINFINELNNFKEKLPYLSKKTIDEILLKSNNVNFIWQDKATDFLRNNSSKYDSNLILNLGTTGSGKTRMNVKALAAINDKLRITSVFNLKSLTLQTGEAYKKQLKLQPAEIDVVIGDTDYLEKMQDSDVEVAFDNDDILNIAPNLTTSEQDFISKLSYIPKTIKNIDFLNVPALVSTIDFCIAAGDISQGTNHISAFLRILSSDLIIDEIDSYEPEMFESVLRLISIATMLNRNIVISSATLSRPYFNMIREAFLHGKKLKEHLNNKKYKDNIFLISNLVEAQLYCENNNFEIYIQKMCERFTENKEKLAKVLSLDLMKNNEDEDNIPPIFSFVKEFHINNNQNYQDKFYSFGLIRFGTIKKIIKLAKKLESLNCSNSILNIDSNRKESFQIKFITYHSNLKNDKRFDVEKFLDEALNRNHNNMNKLVQETLANSSVKHTIFIVLATPVEEIGRDHDFDWAIIEPSSIQSIIQTSGRVNRHRKVIPTRPNIGLLQYNISYYNKKTNKIPHFTKPGLETKENIYPQDINSLLPISNNEIYITSELRYNSQFAEYDDKSINLYFDDKYKFANIKGNHWIKAEYYNQYRLRNQVGIKLEFEIGEHEFWQIEDNNKKEGKNIEMSNKKNILEIVYPENDIGYSDSLKKWLKICSINIFKDEDKIMISYHPNFGIYIKN